MSLRSQALRFRHFSVTFPGEHIVQVTLDRQDKLNCVDKATSREIAGIWEQFDQDESLWVGIITGAGRAFCTGADLIGDRGRRAEWNAMNKAGVVNGMEAPGLAGLPRRAGKKPIIAAVNGLCMGGGFEMVANCDVVVAASTAVFALPEAKRGIVPVAGCLPRLTRTIGLQRTMDLVLTGRSVDAKTLRDWGLISYVVDAAAGDADAEVVKRAVQVAEEMCQNSPDALIVGRLGVRQSWEFGGVEGAVDDLAAKWYPRLMQGANFAEGIQAFADKRAPRWVDSKLWKSRPDGSSSTPPCVKTLSGAHLIRFGPICGSTKRASSSPRQGRPQVPRPRCRNAYRRTTPAKDVTEQPVASGEKADDLSAGVAPVDSGDKDTEAQQSDDEKHPHENLQRGVQQVEAVTIAWSKWSLIAVFINIWCIYMVNAFQYSILYTLVPFITSEYSSHSLLPIIYIVADTMQAATYIPLSKILDIWGRAEGFALMVFFATIGMIMMAACNSLATFCAAQVFYSVGFGGVIYTIDVITSDISKLKNRGLAFAFTSSPYMISAFAGPKAAESFYENINWRWGFGAFAIILPFVAAPMFFVIKANLKKAAQAGVLPREKSGRTFVQSIWYYLVQFDALGVFLFAAGFTVFLLPFTLAYSAPDGWKTGYIIAMIVVGFVVLVIFGVYESKFSPYPMLNFELLTDRTIIGACILSSVYMVSYYCWGNYFTSFLQVVNNQSMAQAGYISNTFNVVSGFLLFAVGFSIRRTGYFKWLLFIALPIYALGLGLMIHFRRPGQSVGYLIMCQVFISFGGSIFIIIQQVAVLAAVDHQHVAAVLALLNVVGTGAAAIGGTISGAIWTNTFSGALMRNLPAAITEDPDVFGTVYGDITAQLEYENGSPERIGIQQSYGYAQTRMLAAGLGVFALAFLSLILMRNINVKKIKQTRGNVF
ncbi:hypothetical protein QBC39DRAFT_315361 [Podospora conica]|nr:hypothetical protein QBC39DRAFT_315361 [Schizothecium conicum]